MSDQTIPTIDMAKLHEPEMRARLDRACRDWGFFQLINHGVEPMMTDALLKSAGEFFRQPTARKREISRTVQNPWGFFDHELTKNHLDWKEVFDYGPQYGDVLVPRWPEGMPGFRLSVMSYYRACEQIAFDLLGVICENLGTPADFLDHLFEPEHTSFVRLNYYPACPNPESPEGLATPSSGYQGVNHHTDSGVLTILLQDEQPGLEVLKDGAWHLVPPVPGALVVNVGDIVQVWSNDRYKAALHRVRANSENERYSVPFFLNPAYSASYEPLPGSVDASDMAHYRAINWGEFRAARVAGDYQDFGEEIQIEQYRQEVTA